MQGQGRTRARNLEEQFALRVYCTIVRKEPHGRGFEVFVVFELLATSRMRIFGTCAIRLYPLHVPRPPGGSRK